MLFEAPPQYQMSSNGAHAAQASGQPMHADGGAEGTPNVHDDDDDATKASENIGHVPLDAKSLGANTPSKRRSTSDAWINVKRITTKTAQAQALRLEGYTHICAFVRDDGSMCNHLFKLTKPTTQCTWSTVEPVRHLASEHPTSGAAVNHAKRAKVSADTKVGVSLLVGSVTNPLPSAQTLARYQLKPAQIQLTAQAQWYVYADQHLSKRTFDGDYFKRMMHAQASSASAPVLTVRQLILYVRTEFRVFILFVRHLVWEKGKQALGNELWAQLLHDGGTLANHVKYLALGMQVVDPQVRCLRHLRVREGRGVLWRGLWRGWGPMEGVREGRDSHDPGYGRKIG